MLYSLSYDGGKRGGPFLTVEDAMQINRVINPELTIYIYLEPQIRAGGRPTRTTVPNSTNYK